jgi:hypothetical protein
VFALTRWIGSFIYLFIYVKHNTDKDVRMEKPLDPVTAFIPNRGWIICMPGQLLSTTARFIYSSSSSEITFSLILHNFITPGQPLLGEKYATQKKEERKKEE